ncbi:hypothetical protein IWZ00DRAFT_180024 [Phyllosticta capitalensis]
MRVMFIAHAASSNFLWQSRFALVCYLSRLTADYNTLAACSFLDCFSEGISRRQLEDKRHICQMLYILKSSRRYRCSDNIGLPIPEGRFWSWVVMLTPRKRSYCDSSPTGLPNGYCEPFKGMRLVAWLPRSVPRERGS